MRQLYTGIWLILWCETEKPFSTTGFFFFFFLDTTDFKGLFGRGV